MPSFTWLKDNATLDLSLARVQVNNPTANRSVLIISDVANTDEGSYTCTAVNSVATAVSADASMRIEG